MEAEAGVAVPNPNRGPSLSRSSSSLNGPSARTDGLGCPGERKIIVGRLPGDVRSNGLAVRDAPCCSGDLGRSGIRLSGGPIESVGLTGDGPGMEVGGATPRPSRRAMRDPSTGLAVGPRRCC